MQGITAIANIIYLSGKWSNQSVLFHMPHNFTAKSHNSHKRIKWQTDRMDMTW